MDIVHFNHQNRDTYQSKTDQVVAIGFFDGLHRGHQKVIKEAKKIAEKKQLPLACMSFFPHPKEVLTNNNKQFQYIMPLAEKQKELENMGIETLYLIEFDLAFASLSPEQFVQKYLLDLGVTYVVAGFDFTYGSRGMGNMDRIQADSHNQLEAIKVEKVAHNGKKVSSTLLRQMIHSGQMDQIHHYLGRDYQIEAEVFLNKYDADVDVKNHYLIPPSGIYDVKVQNESGSWRQEAIVDQGQIKLPLTKGSEHLIKQDSNVRIHWINQLFSGLLSHVMQSV